MDEHKPEEKKHEEHGMHDHKHEGNHHHTHAHPHHHKKKILNLWSILGGVIAIILIVVLIITAKSPTDKNQIEKETGEVDQTQIKADDKATSVETTPKLVTCIDSDSDDYLRKGYVTVEDTVVWDTCIDSSSLLEKICKDSKLDEIKLSCTDYGLECKDGKCEKKIQTETPTLPVTQPPQPETPKNDTVTTPNPTTSIKGPIIKNLKVRPVGYVEKETDNNGTIFETTKKDLVITFDVVGLEPITCKANMNAKTPYTTVTERWVAYGTGVTSSLGSVNKAYVKCVSKYGATPVMEAPIKILSS